MAGNLAGRRVDEDADLGAARRDRRHGTHVHEVRDQAVGGARGERPTGDDQYGSAAEDGAGGPHAPGREWLRAALVAQDQRGSRGTAGEAAVRLGAMLERPSERRADVGHLRRHLGQPEALERLVADPDVPVSEAVGDDRAAADDRLEHGQPGARVDERVAGGEHVAHPVGEAHDPQPGLGAELARHPGAQLVVAPAQAQHDRVRHLQGGARRAEQVADAPAAA